MNPARKTTYFGYGTAQDKIMLAKYGVRIHLVVIQELLRRSRFAGRLATEGSGLESAYLIVTGELPNLESHDGPEELRVMFRLYKKAMRLKKNDLLTVMPFGHCAGMPIGEYVQKYRRAADGYRRNNTDLLSVSLEAAIVEGSSGSHYDWDDGVD